MSIDTTVASVEYCPTRSSDVRARGSLIISRLFPLKLSEIVPRWDGVRGNGTISAITRLDTILKPSQNRSTTERFFPRPVPFYSSFSVGRFSMITTEHGERRGTEKYIGTGCKLLKVRVSLRP